MSVSKTCSAVWRPLYGWMGYFFLTTMLGSLKNFYEHGNEWLLFVTIMCTLINIPLDMHISYLYFFNQIDFFYEPEDRVRLAFGGILLISVTASLIFLWINGKGLLIIADSKQNYSRNHKPITSEDQDTTNICSSHADIVQDEECRKDAGLNPTRNIFQSFKILFGAIYLSVIGPVSMYPMYSYIVRCSATLQSTVTAKLVIAGIILPILITISATNATYKMSKRGSFLKRFRPIPMLCSTLTILSGVGALWLFAVSLVAVGQLRTGRPAAGTEYKLTDQAPSVILQKRSTSIYITSAAEILSSPRSKVSFECTKKHKAIGILCDEIEFSFRHDKTSLIVYYDYQIKYENDTLSSQNAIGSVQWSCSLCHTNGLMSERTNYRNMASATAEECVTTPMWQYHILIGCATVMAILYCVIIAATNRAARVASESAISETQTTKFTKPTETDVTRVMEETPQLKARQKNNRASLSKFKAVEKALTWAKSGSVSNGRKPSQPRIIRVPKGTALDMLRQDKAIRPLPECWSDK